MKIYAIREGTATNSSATHSVLLKKPGIKEIRDEYTDDHSLNSFYCAASEVAKIELALRHLRGQFCDESDWKNPKLKPEFADVKKLIDPKNLVSMDTCEGWDMSPDHGVQFHFPLKHGSDNVHEEFVQDFMEDWLHPDVFIIGSRDECFDDDPAYNGVKDKESHLDDLTRHLHYAVTAVKIGPKAYVLMQRSCGNKIRVQFGDQTASPKTFVPELVDINITDFCTHGCSYCYRGCTESGKHASLENMTTLFKILQEHQVLEVALGGGEPLQHPDFWTIAERAKYYGMHVNVSTRDEAILRDPEILAKGVEFLHGIGISTQRCYHMDDLGELRKYAMQASQRKNRSYGSSTLDVVLHIAMGTMSRNDIKETLKDAEKHYIPLLLLGYKPYGRGFEYKNSRSFYEYSWLGAELDKYFKKSSYGDNEYYWSGPKVSFDTVLVGEMAEWLTKHKVDRRHWQEGEGLNSCFVDAVNMTMAKSSFEGAPVKFNKHNFIDIWKSF